MAKTIILNGNVIPDVEEVRTSLLATNKTQSWIPIDEVNDYLDLDDITANRNGIYRVQNPGETREGVISDDGRRIEKVYACDGFSSANVNVSHTFDQLSTQKGGTYKSENDGFSSVEVDIQPKMKTLYVSQNGHYTSKDKNFDGYDKVVVDIQDPPEAEPYISLTIKENGSYSAEDIDKSYGYDNIKVETPDTEVKKVRWEKIHSYELTEIDQSFTYDMFENVFGFFGSGSMHNLFTSKDHTYMIEFDELPDPLQPRFFVRRLVDDDTGEYVDLLGKPFIVEGDKYIHILGGYNPETQESGNHYTTPRIQYSNSVKKMETLPFTPVSGTTLNGELYLLDTDGFIWRNHVDIWEKVTHIMGDVTAPPKLQACNGVLYLIGLMNNPEAIYSFDPFSPNPEWKTIQGIGYVVKPNVIVHNGKIRIIGTKRDSVNVDSPCYTLPCSNMLFDQFYSPEHDGTGHETVFCDRDGNTMQSDFCTVYEGNFNSVYAVGIEYGDTDHLVVYQCVETHF